MRGWLLLFLVVLAISPVHSMEAVEGSSTSSLGTSPAWSPDGRLIAYQGSDYDIWIMLKDGTGNRRLTDDIYRDEQPVFSPDGELLAYVSERGGRQELWIMESDGTGKKQLTLGDGWKHSPTWGPDGTRLAYIVSPEKNGEGDIWMMDLITGEAKQLTTDGGLRSVSWNPVDGRLAFLSMNDGSYDIQLMDPNTGLDELLFEDTYWKGQLTWSPDGNRMAFVSYHDGNYDIWLLEDGEVERVTSKKSWQVSPAWSPNGMGIAYASDENGVYEIWVKEMELVPVIIVEENPVIAPADAPAMSFVPEVEALTVKSAERSTFEKEVPVLQLSEEIVSGLGDGELVPINDESEKELLIELEPLDAPIDSPVKEPARDFMPIILAVLLTSILVILSRRLHMKLAGQAPLWSDGSVPF